MKYVRGFALFWYDFVIGDDWHMAAGVVLALAATAALVAAGVNAWWLMPAAALALLSYSLWRFARGP